MNRKDDESKTPPEPIYTFKGNQAQIHSLSYLLNSKEEKLLVGARDGKVHVWDFETRRQVHNFTAGQAGSCISIITSNDDELVTHSRGEAVLFWSRHEDGTWTTSGRLNAPGQEYCGAQLVTLGSGTSPIVMYPAGDGVNLLVASPRNNMVLLNIATDKSQGSVMSVSSAGQDLVMALFETGTLFLWDLKHCGTPLSSLKLALGNEEGVAAMCLAFDAASRQGVVGSSSASIASFCLNSDQCLAARPATSITNRGISAASIRGDSKLIATAGWDSRVRLFSWRKSHDTLKSPLRPLAVLDSHTSQQGLQCVSFSPSSVQSWNCKGLVATAGEAATVVMWDIYNS